MRNSIFNKKSFITEIKITLPLYFIALGFMFAMFLPIICSVSTYDEIGPIMDSKFSFLAIIIFSNTYYLEIQQKTSEVFYMIPKKQKKFVINKRFLIKFTFVILLFIMSYLLFNFDKPYLNDNNSYTILFFQAVFAVGSSMLFWGTLSQFLVNILHSLWAGIGITIVFWSIMDSTIGRSLPIALNMFAYGDIDAWGAVKENWQISKIIAFIIAFILIYVNVYIIKQSPSKFKE